MILGLLALMSAASAQPSAEDAASLLIDRVNKLEKRVSELELRNSALERDLGEARAQPNVSPVEHVQAAYHSDDSSNFTFRPHVTFEQDSAAFFERRGGYDFNSGSLLRHASVWADGDYGRLSYQITADLPNGTISVTDAWLRYRFTPTLFITAGLQKAPFGFQYSNNDNYDIFIERSMFGNAAAGAGSGRRVGASATLQNDRFTLAAGVFGDNAGIGRAPRTSQTNTPDESWGVNARAAWRPLLRKASTFSLGLSAYHRQSLRAGDVENAVRFTDRPNIRVDGGNIADSGVVPNVHALDYLGGEVVGMFGPLTLSGEYGSAWLRRSGQPDVRFGGFYGMTTLILTGENHGLVRGQLARLRPIHEIGESGLGALELALRYDRIDLSKTPVAANHGNQASTLTVGLNWYLTPYAKVLINYIRFSGRVSPLNPVGDEVQGDVIATRLHVDM